MGSMRKGYFNSKSFCSNSNNNNNSSTKTTANTNKSFYPNNDTVASMFSRLKNETDKMRQEAGSGATAGSGSPVYDYCDEKKFMAATNPKSTSPGTLHSQNQNDPLLLEERVNRLKQHLRYHLDLYDSMGGGNPRPQAPIPIYASELLRAIGEALAQQNKIHEALLYTRASWEMKQGNPIPERTLIRNLTRLADFHLLLNEPKMAVLALMDALPLLQRMYGYDSRQAMGVRKQISFITNQQRGWVPTSLDFYCYLSGS